MFGLGTGELVIILLIVVVLFGATKLPQLGEGLGKALRGFKNAAQGDDAPEKGGGEEAKPPSPDRKGRS